MKYRSSFTKSVKIAIFLLLLFWAINFLAIINSNGIKDALVFFICIFVFTIIFILALVKGINITVENNRVKYSQTWVLRRTVDVGKINKIQKGLMDGLYSSLSLISEDSGKSKDIKISTITFKKDILKQFVLDLKKQNPQIIIDPTVNEIIS